MRKLVLFLGLAILITGLILTGCGESAPAPSAPASTTPTTPTPAPAPTTPTPAPTTPQYGGTLRVIESMSPPTPIGWPAEATGASGGTVGISLQGLLAEKLDGSIVPLLAESYEVNSDPTNPSITFKLKRGVKFHDGTELNAQAVKWNFESVKASPLNTSITGSWKSIDVIDDYAVRVNLTQWRNLAPRDFTGMASVLVSPAAYEKNGVDWMKWNMVGTTAFKQVDFQRDVTLKTVRNDDYWEEGKPYLDGLDLIYVADETTRDALFRSGDADVMGVSPMRASELEADGYKIVTQQGSSYVLVPDSINQESPWSNLKVREAAEYAIDKENIAKTFGYGYWNAAYQLPDSTSPAQIPNLEKRTYNQEKAKQLLAEAGYPDGFKTRIIASNRENRDILVAIKANLDAVGIQTDLDIVEMAMYTKTYTGTWDNALIYIGMYWYPNFNAVANFWLRAPKSTNFQSLKKPDNWNDVFSASLSSPTIEPGLMQKMAQSLYDDDAVIPVYHSTGIYAITDKVQGYARTRGGSGFWDPQDVWLSK